MGSGLETLRDELSVQQNSTIQVLQELKAQMVNTAWTPTGGQCQPSFQGEGCPALLKMSHYYNTTLCHYWDMSVNSQYTAQ